MKLNRNLKKTNSSEWRADRNSPRPIKDKKSKLQSLRASTSLVFLIAFIVWIPLSSVRCIDQNGDQCTYLNEYKMSVEQFAGGIFRFIPLIDYKQLEQELVSRPSVESAEVFTRWFLWLNADIIERSAFALWTIANRDEQYLVDRTGYLMGLASEFDFSSTDLPLFVDTALVDRVDSPVPPELIAMAGLLQTVELENLNFDFVEIGSDPREMTAVYNREGQQDIRLRLTSERAIELQLIDAKVAMEYLSRRNASFNHIDVRLASGVVWY